MANLRAGLIGLAMMGRHRACVLAILEGVELVGVADAGPTRRRRWSPAACGHRRAHRTGAGLLRGRRLDHLPRADRTCVCCCRDPRADPEAGHSIDTPSARKVGGVFATQGLIGGVGHIGGYNPALQFARVRLEAGGPGTVYQGRTRARARSPPGSPTWV